MEFPELGRHCAAENCSRLDFLPFECDACHNVYCKDHGTYEAHGCKASHTKDARVPVCPLCDQPVPVNRGEDPNIKVDMHIQNDCRSEKAKKISNRCSVPGCKKKELVPVMCSTCRKNFCLKHRFETDHNCQGHPNKLGGRGVNRDSSKVPALGSGKKGGGGGGGGGGGRRGGRVGAPQKTTMSSIGAELNRERMMRQQNRGRGATVASPSNQHTTRSPHLQPSNIAEDEALALAMAASMTDSTPLPPPPSSSSSHRQSKSNQRSPQANRDNTAALEEDEALARAIAASLNDKDPAKPRPKPVARDGSKHQSSDKNETCVIS